MTLLEFVELKEEFPNLRAEKAYHCHDEDSWNKVTLSLNGIIVGSELVGPDFVRSYIKKNRKYIYGN